MTRTHTNYELHTTTPEGSAGEWVSATLNDEDLHVLAASEFDPVESYAKAVAAGRSMADQMAAEHSVDPGVARLTRLLGTLAENINDDSSQTGDFLGLLDQQAVTSENPTQTRQRQLAGLLDIMACVVRDEELTKWLQDRE